MRAPFVVWFLAYFWALPVDGQAGSLYFGAPISIRLILLMHFVGGTQPLTPRWSIVSPRAFLLTI